MRKALWGIVAVMMVGVGIAFWQMGGRVAPVFSGETIAGRAFNTAEWRGKPVLLTFWATSCASCVAEIPHWVTLHQSLVPRGLEMLAIAMSYDVPEQVNAMVAQRSIPYPIVWDKNGTIAKTFDDVRLTPTTVLISPKGEIVYYHLGSSKAGQLEELIKPLLPE